MSPETAGRSINDYHVLIYFLFKLLFLHNFTSFGKNVSKITTRLETVLKVIIPPAVSLRLVKYYRIIEGIIRILRRGSFSITHS